MSSPPHLPLTDAQADIPGSLFSSSSLCPHSPQLSPISSLIAQSPKVDPETDPALFWYEAYYGDDAFMAIITSHFLDGDVVELHPPYNSHAPSTMDPSPSNHPSIIKPDGGSTPSLPTSPVTLTPVIRPTCICGCGGSACIRQRPYRRPKGDPLADDHIGELITFQVHGQCGMPLMSALRCVYSGLSGRDDPMFVGSRSSISIRLEWPDCPPWAQQMRTKDWRRKPSPITKAKLATEIAKKVNHFLKDMRRAHRGRQGDIFSPSHLDINRLVLVALEHVSIASWQPHFRLI